MSQTQIKIMKHKPAITDEEIRSHMDFDKLLQMNKELVAKTKMKSVWLKTAGYSALTVSIVGLISYYSLKSPNENILPENQSLDPQKEVLQPNSVDSLKSTNRLLQPNDTYTADESAVKSDKVKQSNNPDIKSEIKSTTTEVQKADTTRKQSLVKFTEAEPLDGYPALYQYFNTKLQYPVEMAKDSIEGTVVVSFIIDVKGSPGSIKVINSLGQAFDRESIRIIENMPKWKAATINGEPTATRLSIPLTFKILK